MIRKSHGVAIAALALAASSAFAQSSVKVYGLLDVGFGHFQDAHPSAATGTSVNGVESGLMTTSFIGFSGTEDLGGGLKAEFALESFLAVDTGVAGGAMGNLAGGWWSRTSNVALSGGFGKVALGQYDNPLFTFGYTYNPFGSSMAMSPTMRHYYYGNSGIAGAGVAFDTGWVNSITYETPNLSGFSAIAQYSAKEAGKASYAIGATYAAGPLSASLVYEDAGTNVGFGANEKVWALGASYDLGVVKGFFQYTDVDEDGGPEDKIWQIGLSAPVGPGTVLASYGQLKSKIAGANNGKDKVLSLAYDYALSKRTDVYVGLWHNSQDDTANDESGTSVAVGLRHNF